LRDFGATVTKIEPPYPGDYMALWPPMAGPVSATYLAVNHGKQIMSLNLKDAGERERFYELARGADVVVEGFRPGVIDKLGIGYARLAELNPGIIVCSISGYGQSGPYAQRGGHDLNYQALAGVLSIAGDQALRPPNPRLQTADTAAGSYAAAMLILAALLERQKTGRGRHLDVSMSEQLLPLATTLHAAAQAEQRDPASDGELLSGGAPCYRIYRTKDGGQISVGALAEVFATRTRDEWAAAFAAVDACVEPVLTFSETRRHPQWQARESFERLPTPDGREILAPKMPGSLAGFGR
jgi:crotonobetainyl-CoA:carnitine CoA-transferase CaiB-like acyl-CoA transferase